MTPTRRDAHPRSPLWGSQLPVPPPALSRGYDLHPTPRKTLECWEGSLGDTLASCGLLARLLLPLEVPAGRGTRVPSHTAPHPPPAPLGSYHPPLALDLYPACILGLRDWGGGAAGSLPQPRLHPWVPVSHPPSLPPHWVPFPPARPWVPILPSTTPHPRFWGNRSGGEHIFTLLPLPPASPRLCIWQTRRWHHLHLRDGHSAPLRLCPGSVPEATGPDPREPAFSRPST